MSTFESSSFHLDSDPVSPFMPPRMVEYGARLSPRILLSPSSPEFPAIDLRPAEVGCQDAPGYEEEPKEAASTAPDHSGKRMDKTLRQSLLLLDTTLAELATIGYSAATTAPRSGSALIAFDRGSGAGEQLNRVQNDEDGPIDFMLARGSFAGPATQRDASLRSLASVASESSSHRSSEDAFDIVDFPSVGQLDLGNNSTTGDALNLAISTRLPPSPRNRSSDLMAFPVPPSDVSPIPLEHASTLNSLELEDSLGDDQVFEHLASLGQGDAVRGLGLFSSAVDSRPSSRLARSETETDSASVCSTLSSSLDASTLASSYAPTVGFGRSTNSCLATDAMSSGTTSTPSIYARRAANAARPIPSPPVIFTSQAPPTPSVPASLGSPFYLERDCPTSPASLSPYSFAESPQNSPALTSGSPLGSPFRASAIPLTASPTPRDSSQISPAPSRSPSRADLGFAELHQASLGLLGSFDDGGIPVWAIRPEDNYSRNYDSLLDDGQVEILEDPQPHGVDGPERKRGAEPSSSSLGSPFGALRRLSSFQMLRKRKSDNVPSTNPPAPRPVLSKPRSEAALSTFARQQAAVADKAVSSKENASPGAVAPGRLGRLSFRSVSSPRLSKLASPSPRIASPVEKPDSTDGSDRASPGSPGKRRFSSKQFFKTFEDPVPPVPPTPTEHLSGHTSGDTPRVAAGSAGETTSTEADVSVRGDLDMAADPPTPTSCSADLPTTPTIDASAVTLLECAAPSAASANRDASDPITLATFLGGSCSDFPSRSSSSNNVSRSHQSKQARGDDSPMASPLGDRTNWSRPTSPALLDALKSTSPNQMDDLVFVPQQVMVFPVRLPPASAGAVAAATAFGLEGEGEDEDDYGDESDSDEDKPLGIVPGALTAQKSLRKCISKKKKKKPKSNPFEFEQAAALLPPATRSDYPRHSLTGSADEVKNSQGHDSFLPQTDASIERKASSNGLRRSPSTPLDPMIAQSALTLDSPIFTHEPLPMLDRHDSLHGPTAPLPRKNVSPRTNQPSPTPVPSVLAPAQAAPPRSRPPPVPQPPSRRPSQGEPQGVHLLARRPSLHPDVAQLQSSPSMQRQASSSSSRSTTNQDSANPSNRPGLGQRSRSGTLPGGGVPPIDRRVYLGRPGAKHLTIKVTDRTLAGEIVAYARGRGALDQGNENEGGWALWEVWPSMGLGAFSARARDGRATLTNSLGTTLERPVREYEFVNDIIASFDGDSAVFVLRRATLWPVLSSHARAQPTTAKVGQVQVELKPAKWSKRFLELRDGALSHSKSDKLKDPDVLCQLSNFSAFYVDDATTRRLKAPKPFVFALKSRLTRAHFEEVSQYCNFVCVKSKEELQTWITSITEAGNHQARQREQAILGTPQGPPLPTSPLLSGPSAPPALVATGVEHKLPLPDSKTQSRGFLARAASSRPAPAVLTPTSDNRLPIRRSTVTKPLVDLR
ncbi:hypothetical protein JCM16303_002249 [Sporobolomyces ruberrimus]